MILIFRTFTTYTFWGGGTSSCWCKITYHFPLVSCQSCLYVDFWGAWLKWCPVIFKGFIYIVKLFIKSNVHIVLCLMHNYMFHILTMLLACPFKWWMISRWGHWWLWLNPYWCTNWIDSLCRKNKNIKVSMNSFTFIQDTNSIPYHMKMAAALINFCKTHFLTIINYQRKRF